MSYTAAQLIAAYTAANGGIAPDAPTERLLEAFAAQNAAGTLSDQAVLSYVINSASEDVQLAIQPYQFFTGKTPSRAGIDYLISASEPMAPFIRGRQQAAPTARSLYRKRR